jgi:hypothetical protein
LVYSDEVSLAVNEMDVPGALINILGAPPGNLAKNRVCSEPSANQAINWLKTLSSEILTTDDARESRHYYIILNALE